MSVHQHIMRLCSCMWLLLTMPDMLDLLSAGGGVGSAGGDAAASGDWASAAGALADPAR